MKCKNDIRGKPVSASECTTPDKNILCENCEQLFRHIDRCAFDFWKDLSTNWGSLICENGVDITDVVMFSFVARVMLYYASISNYNDHIHPCIINDAMQAFRVEALCTQHERIIFQGATMKDECKMITCAYKSTRRALAEIGFMCHKLTQNHDHAHCRNRKYRIEFPFRCALKLPGMTKSFEAVCAQVPPFFCLIPIDPRDTDALKQHLHNIVLAVHDKLQTKLEEFLQEVMTTSEVQGIEESQKQYCENINTWLAESRRNENFAAVGPLLFYDYLDRETPLNIDVHEHPWCVSVSCSICCLSYYS